MKRTLFTSLALAGVLLAGSALADEGDGTGVELGLRLGYGVPLGSAAENADLSDFIKGQIPIWVDLGYRITPNVMAGAYFFYGFGLVADRMCQEPADCSAHDMRLGLQGQYRFSPDGEINPWLGAGVGLEWLGNSAEVSQGAMKMSLSSTLFGIQFLDLQGGVDFAVSETAGIGPFLSLSLAQFNSGSASASCSGLPAGFSCNSSGTDGDINNKALHEWLIIGARGVYGL
jgi:hypothetical protein